jgi:hypothetical protein
LIPTIFVAGGAGLTTGFPGLYRYGSVWIAAHIGLGK